MKKMIISESDKNRILEMYGLISEQKYMETYSGTLLDFCGYRAIEKFEETMGDPNGQSMGDNYFEKKVNDYESKISDNIQNTIGLSVFNRLPAKMKMQIWSFMFNGTDASTGTVKWLAGLSQAINMSKFLDDKEGQDYRIKVSKQGSQDYNKAINEIINFKGDWNNVYNNYLIVLDKQYKSTAENNNKNSSYNNSWQYRPSNLSKYYDECGSGKKSNVSKKTVTNNNTTKDYSEGVFTTGSVDLEKDSFNKLSKKIQDFSKRKNDIGVGEFKLFYDKNENKIKIEISDDQKGKKYSILVLAINDEAKRAQESKGYEIIKSGKIQLPNEFASSKPGGYDWYLFGNPVN
jgi:hypothetical protein